MKRFVTGAVLVAMLVVTPGFAQAATYTYITPAYNSMTTDEKLAYLYGMIAQLQLLLQLSLQVDNSSTVVGVVRPLNTSRNRADVEIDTLSATDIQDDEAELRARIDLDGEDEATVWFEYSQDDDGLDDRTAKKRVYDNYGDVQTIAIVIDDLDEDERYYFRAVVEDEDGDRSYGDIRYFTTDDRYYSSNNNYDFDLDVSDTSIDAGDYVTVYWDIPSDEEGSRNWIGLYEVGDDNDEYIKWGYIDNDDSGSETFRIDDEGDYEFRLFLDNSYDDEVTSREVSVD